MSTKQNVRIATPLLIQVKPLSIVSVDPTTARIEFENLYKGDSRIRDDDALNFAFEVFCASRTYIKQPLVKTRLKTPKKNKARG